MKFEMPKAGDEYINIHDDKTRFVVRIEKRSGETNVILKCLDCISSDKEFPVNIKQWEKSVSFGGWKKK